MVACFHANKVDEGWLCDGDSKSPVHLQVVAGDFLTRWFPTHELPSNVVLTEGIRGAYVDAIVLEVVPQKGKNTYKCSFDAPLSRECTYGEDEIDMYRKRYLERKAPSPLHCVLAPAGKPPQRCESRLEMNTVQ